MVAMVIPPNMRLLSMNYITERFFSQDNSEKGKTKTASPNGDAVMHCVVILDGPFNLVGTEASGTSIHMARSTVDNRLNALDVGLPGSVGTSVGVRDLNTEGYALATKITLSHSLHLLSPIISKFRFFTSALI